jgi:hypothetical protein
MSCAFLNCGETCGGQETTDLSLSTCPYAALADGLHAIAQPLTILRGALGAWKLRGSIPQENDRYLDMSAKQVERIGDLLSSLQDVLDTADGDPSPVKLDLGALVGFVVYDMNSLVREWGGTIKRTDPDVCVHVRGDAERIERALRAALRAAISISSAGEEIVISLRSHDGQIELKVESTALRGKNLSFTERLNLSLAKTNVRRQSGGYACVEDPLCIVFTLPAHTSGEMAQTVSLDSSACASPTRANSNGEDILVTISSKTGNE